MTTTSRRLAASLALALPATFLSSSPAAQALTAPTPAPAPARPAAATPTMAPAKTTKPGDWRWRDYVAQKPVWKTSNCTEITLAAAEQLLPATSGLRVECAVVRTPLSWADLSKGSLKLGMTRVVVPVKAGAGATGKRSAPTQRLLLLNPGGPGGEAGSFVPLTAAVKPGLLATHQLVGVDPRGVGLSSGLRCAPQVYNVTDPIANPAKAWRAIAASSKAFVTGCVKAQGELLPHITTVNTVHDMDFARRLLGYRTTDWYGVSAGTWMGSWLAQLHPKTVGRVVLDANTEFTTDWRSSFAELPMGFQRRFHAQFVPWVARAHAKLKLGGTPAAVRASYAKIRAASSRGKVVGVTPMDLDLITQVMMYQDAQFPLWAGILSDVNVQLTTTGRATPQFPQELTNVMVDPATTVVRTAILCNDTRWSRSEASYRREFLDNTKRYPYFAYLHSTVTSVCAYWPYQGQPAPTIDGSGTPKMLMVQTELDPATPIEGARRAHAANRSTRLLFVDDQGSHGAYLSANTCVDRHVSAYLARGTLPEEDVTCQGVPLPGEKKVFEVDTDPPPSPPMGEL